MRCKVRTDSEAVRMDRRFFGDEFVNSIAVMSSKERSVTLRRERNCGLSVRQIERFTGIGRGIIQKV